MTAKDEPGTEGPGTGEARRLAHSANSNQRGRRSRASIVDAARQVFERDGYFDARVEDIVALAGVARGSFYTYFTSKSDVLEVIAADALGALADASVAPTDALLADPIGLVRRFNTQYLAAYKANARMIEVLTQVAVVDPVHQQARLDGRRRMVDSIADAISAWQDLGIADPAIDPQLTAAGLASMMTNFAYWWMVGNDPQDDATATEGLITIWVKAIGLDGNRVAVPTVGAAPALPLDGRVALVTGAGRGIGAAIAHRLSAAGATLVVSDIDHAAAIACAGEIGPNATAMRLDVSSEGDWTAAVADIVERFGHLDVLVNSAGTFQAQPLHRTTLDDYRHHVEVNQIGTFLGLHHASRPMVAVRRGSIVNIASGVATRGIPGAFAYGASKWAVRGMGSAAAAELAPKGVRVNTIFPGTIETEMTASNGADAIAALRASIPLGRLGAPDEVADLVVFLSTDLASYITGAEIRIDGGRHL